jgi:hypothetical protein
MSEKSWHPITPSQRRKLTKTQKRKRRKLKNLHLEKGWILDCHTALKEDYDPMEDPHIQNYFLNHKVRNNLYKTGIINKKGHYVRRVIGGYNSGIWERTIKIPAYLLNKRDNPGKTKI